MEVNTSGALNTHSVPSSTDQVSLANRNDVLGGQSLNSHGGGFLAESHLREIEEQVVRRMRDQMQKLEDDKANAEKRCETAQQ